MTGSTKQYGSTSWTSSHHNDGTETPPSGRCVVAPIVMVVGSSNCAFWCERLIALFWAALDDYALCTG